MHLIEHEPYGNNKNYAYPEAYGKLQKLGGIEPLILNGNVPLTLTCDNRYKSREDHLCCEGDDKRENFQIRCKKSVYKTKHEADHDTNKNCNDRGNTLADHHSAAASRGSHYVTNRKVDTARQHYEDDAHTCD